MKENRFWNLTSRKRRRYLVCILNYLLIISNPIDRSCVKLTNDFLFLDFVLAQANLLEHKPEDRQYNFIRKNLMANISKSITDLMRKLRNDPPGSPSKKKKKAIILITYTHFRPAIAFSIYMHFKKCVCYMRTF
jgi:hypothetical protein